MTYHINNITLFFYVGPGDWYSTYISTISEVGFYEYAYMNSSDKPAEAVRTLVKDTMHFQCLEARLNAGVLKSTFSFF